MDDSTTFVGLDVSKTSISVGIAPDVPKEADRYFGAIKPDAESCGDCARSWGAAAQSCIFVLRRARLAISCSGGLKVWGIAVM